MGVVMMDIMFVGGSEFGMCFFVFVEQGFVDQ